MDMKITVLIPKYFSEIMRWMEMKIIVIIPKYYSEMDGNENNSNNS